MSEIMCKCGHEISKHDKKGCDVLITDTGGNVRWCMCNDTPSVVTKKYIDAQAAEIERLIAENATLRAENARLADEAERLRNGVGKNKLFVWKDVLTDYASGIMCALAPDADAAREIIVETQTKKNNSDYAESYQREELAKEPEVIDVDTLYGWTVQGGG